MVEPVNTLTLWCEEMILLAQSQCNPWQNGRRTQRKSCRCTRLSRILAGTLTGTFCWLSATPYVAATPLTGTLLAQTQTQATMILGVVRSPDNANNWGEITRRVEATGVTYRVIELAAIPSSPALAEITTLFLPNIEVISTEQLLAIENWLRRGGGLIVSGAVGQRSPHGVQQALRSLLGAYWAQPITQPAALEPVFANAHRWARDGNTAHRVQGGIVIPISLSSQTAVTWNQNATSNGQPAARREAAAVVTTRQTTFIGWSWGDDANRPVEFDRAWLQAALTRFQNLTPLADIPTAATPPLPSSPPLPIPARVPGSLPTPRLPSTPSGSTAPAPTQDPAEQVAPAGLQVAPGNRPISPREAIAMRQELENLMGRFESALLAANAANFDPNTASLPPQMAMAANTRQLSASDESPLLASAGTRAQSAPQVVEEARKFLDQFADQIARQDYTTARQQWLRTRQLLWDHFPTDRPLMQQPEIRAMWLDRGTIVAARSRQGLERIFDRLAAAGINTVFFETVNAGYPIYPSQVAPQQNPLTVGWDPLADAIALAHERGIELHAWVWVFAAGNNAHNPLINRPANYPGPLIAANPDWAGYDHRGNLIPAGQGKPFLDPANPEVRRYLLRLFEEIVTRYDVDGLQLDYIRYPFQDPAAGRSYGYGTAARQQFQNITGVDPRQISPSDRQRWQQWTEFRIRQVDSFVAETARVLRQRRPSLILSAAVFPLPEHERLQQIQQHWETWARQGDVDLIVTMSYAMDTHRLQQLTGPWFTPRSNLGSVLVLPAIRLLNLPEPAAVDQIQALRDMPAGGYSLFAVADLSDTLHSIFNRTQATATTRPQNRSRLPATPIPYRHPFASTVARYAALQQEWSFMINTGQLQLTDQQLQDLQTRADTLGQALVMLADRPTRHNLQRAQTELGRFRLQFERLMRLSGIHQSYRVRTWNNRLAMLETLLNYGDRRVLQSQIPEPRLTPRQ